MPLSKHFQGHGDEVMKSMQKTYGPKKAESVFYATENAQKNKRKSSRKASRSKGR